MSEPVTQYLAKLAARLRRTGGRTEVRPTAQPAGAMGRSACACDDYDWMRRLDGVGGSQEPLGYGPSMAKRNDWGVPGCVAPEERPDLVALVGLVKGGCRGVVDLDWEDWLVVCDELTYQIARRLAKDGRVELPNLGRLEIVHAAQGPQGRLALAQEAQP